MCLRLHFDAFSERGTYPYTARRCVVDLCDLNGMLSLVSLDTTKRYSQQNIPAKMGGHFVQMRDSKNGGFSLVSPTRTKEKHSYNR